MGEEEKDRGGLKKVGGVKASEEEVKENGG